MKRHIPNILTLGNLLCGVLAIRAIFNEKPVIAIGLVGIAAILDFFDGFVARTLGVSGELGKQLDSLADNVTFGVVPGIMLLSIAGFLTVQPVSTLDWLVFISCLLVPAMATMRLAIFNIDTKQSHGFIGMPTPGNTLLIASLYFLFFKDPMAEGIVASIISVQWVILIIALITAFWQIAPIPLMALKFKTYKFKENSWRYMFILIAAVLVLILQVGAIPLIIVCYFLFSLLANRSTKTTV